MNVIARTPFVLARSSSYFPKHLKDAALRLKLLSILSVPFAFVDLKKAKEKILANVQAKDAEGVSLSLLSFSLLALDAVDSSMTFVNTSLSLLQSSSLAIFNALVLPFGFALSSLGILSRSLQLIKTHRLYRSILCKNMKSWEGTSERVLLRAAPAETLPALLRVCQQRLPLTTDLQNCLLSCLKTKMALDVTHLFSNTLSFGAVALFAAGSSSGVPFLLLALCASLKLLASLYQDTQPKQSLPE
ncbi:MAG: hypothetical protein FJZ63_00525 [Chlamydiae bacterium]|nr:hypothetical protein [Chlamydiota bacterium]